MLSNPVVGGRRRGGRGAGPARLRVVGTAAVQYTVLRSSVIGYDTQNITVTTSVADSAVLELTANQARLLVVLDQQRTQNNTTTQPNILAPLLVSAERTGGPWQVSDLQGQLEQHPAADPAMPSPPKRTAGQGTEQWAALRDSGLLAAEHDAVLFTTMDYRTATQDLATWTTAATGSLSDQLRHGQNGFVQQVLTAKTATTGTLDSAGPTEVDPAGLTVKVLALVTVHITTPNSALTNKTIPLDVTVTDTDGQWLASLMNELPGQ